MKNSNLAQKIGIAIIVITWTAKLISKFLDGNTAETLSNVSYFSLLGIIVWTFGYFKKESDNKKSK